MSVQNIKERKNNSDLIKLETIRQNIEIEEFVYDFMQIWIAINEKVKGASLECILDISIEILNSHVIQFYNKYKKMGFLVKQDGWMQDFASVFLTQPNLGGFFLPLKLVAYEIAYHEKGLLDRFLHGLNTREIKGESEELFNYIFPVLINFVAPLDKLEILILKAYQALLGESENLYRIPAYEEFAKEVNVSPRTIIRRLETIKLLQIVNGIMFLDMAKLGYETSIIVHSTSIPKEFEKYILLSTDLTIGKFTIVQIPYNLPKEMMKLEESIELIFIHQLSQRITSWNLAGLSTGEILWEKQPPFFTSDPELSIVTPSPVMNYGLVPSYNTFRNLSPADIKILDFFITTGMFKSVNQLSKAINVSSREINQRLKEYKENNLITKTFQYFNIGLDLSIMFFISDEGTKIPWEKHLLTFPKIDILFQKEEKPNYYFGYLKMPYYWVKDFAKKIDLIKRDYEVKIYYKIASPVDQFKWGLSLKETYQNINH